VLGGELSANKAAIEAIITTDEPAFLVVRLLLPRLHRLQHKPLNVRMPTILMLRNRRGSRTESK
jgi:hypothetical protein